MSWDIEQVKREIRGPAGLAMATFDDGLRLDVEALKGNLRYMVDNGVGDGRGFVICPSGTGEYLSLSDEEHLLMTEAALEVCAGKMAVVSGVAGVNLDDVIARTDAARRAGARYAMVPPPFYYGIDQQGVFDWYRILERVGGYRRHDLRPVVARGAGDDADAAADREAVRAGQHRVAKVR